MKKVLLSSLLLLFAVTTSAQNKIIDSLKAALKTAKHDTTRCDILTEMIDQENDDAIWVKYNDELKKIAEENIKITTLSRVEFKLFKTYLAAALNNTGIIYTNKGDMKKALEYYEMSLKIKEEIGDKNGIANTLHNIGGIYDNIGDTEKALKFFNSSLKIVEEIGDKSGAAQTLNAIGFTYSNLGNMKKALEYYGRSLKLQEEIGDKLETAACINNIGLLYNNHGNTKKALEYYHRSLKLQEEIGYTKGLTASLNNIGSIYYSQGDIPKALEYYGRCLKIREKSGDKNGIANSLNNIGFIYKYQGDMQKALEYYGRSLILQEEIGDTKGVANSLNNIGVLYNDRGNEEKALENYNKSLKLRERVGDKNGIANSLHNIGTIYKNQGELKKALEYYSRSLKLREEVEDKKGLTNSLNNIGSVYIKLASVEKGSAKRNENYKIALDMCTQSMALSKELGFPDNIKNAAELLSKIYKANGKPELALENYELYIRMRDSIANQENKKASIRSQFKYEYEKKAAADSVKVSEEKKVVAMQFKQEKTQRFALYGGLLLVLLFAIFMFNRFRVTQKQKNIIELKEKETQMQKHIIEEKHKEITDSINYAERIQRSFLATKELLDENLKEYFVYFKPKDVVSGDFYWAGKLTNACFALVIADSTGHGVPGAIMSLLNVTSLEKAIEHHTNPAEILTHTRQTIIDRLKKDGSTEGGKDGMDCSLMVFDFANKQLHVAAANNPVWIIRNVSAGDVENGVELIEIKPDKMPVGKSDRQDQPFTLHTIDLQTGDSIYALTDGFPDQFGGPKGKKFMSKKLKELLLANSHLAIHQQKEVLDSTFKNWVGDLEQVDDVCIVGIRI